jgi:hypothetical protein
VVLWFAGLSWVAVWQVFRDPAFDYRLVVVGALAPEVLDAPLGGARVAHTLAFSVALLAAVMVATRGRRVARRRLLALPIGTFLHLVFDGVWGRTEVFWWPLLGASFDGAPLPSVDRGVAAVIVQEVAGLLALAWCWRRFRLHEPDRRAAFWRTGRLGRDLVA